MRLAQNMMRAAPADYEVKKTVELRLITPEELPEDRRRLYEQAAQMVQKVLGGRILIRFGTHSTVFEPLPGSDNAELYGISYLGELDDALLNLAIGHGIAATQPGAGTEYQAPPISQMDLAVLVQRLKAPNDTLEQLWSGMRVNPVPLAGKNFLMLRHVEQGARLSDYQNLTIRLAKITWSALASAFTALRALGSAA